MAGDRGCVCPSTNDSRLCACGSVATDDAMAWFLAWQASSAYSIFTAIWS